MPPSFRRDPDAALAAYERVGYHVEGGLWTAAQCAALADVARTMVPPGPAPPVMNPHRAHPLFLAAMRHPPLRAVMEVLVGGRASGLQSQLFFVRPGTPGFAAHQDNHYVEAAPDVFASAWTALEDVTEENGGLYVYPGSHVEPILPVEPVDGAGAHPGQAANAVRQRTVVPSGYARTDLHMPAGTVVFIHGHLVHGSHDNRSARTRMALLMTYIRHGAPFRPGRSAGRSEVELYAGEALR